ncbi:EFR1 family ferrodoxin [Eubacteriales bacterium KG127]
MIFYFSATGNSKSVAEKLKDEFGGNLYKIDDALRRKEFDHEVPKGETVFFVFPVYFFSMPTVVEDFINSINLKSEDQIDVCAITTSGGNAGGVDKFCNRIFKNKDINYRGLYNIKSVENYILLYKVPLPEAQIMKLRSADKAVEEVIESIKYNFRVPYKSAPFLGLLSWLGNKIYKKTNKTAKFDVDTTKCIKCGLCQFHCPVSAIKMEGGRPVWIKENCAHCLACIHRCPAQAIEYGTKTVNKGRYVNPIFK